MITQMKIEVNPKKIKAINSMPSFSSLKEVQVSAGRIVALGKFMSKLGGQISPFFQALKEIQCGGILMDRRV